MKHRTLIAVSVVGIAVAGLAASGKLATIAERLGLQSGSVNDRPVAVERATETERKDALSAPAVTVEVVSPQEFVARTRVTGSLVARTEILVAPEIEGLRVIELLAEEGDHVTAGQVLARLVQDGLDAQLAQNDAARAKAQAAIAQMSSQIAQAEARDAEASANFERAMPLRKSGTISEAVFEQRQAAARTAAAALVASRDALKVAEAERAQVAAQRRELAWRIGNTDVKAPAGGIVSRRTARVGGLATAVGEPMFRIVANGEIELEAEVPETEIAAISAGQPVEITVAGGRAARGKVRLVSPEIDKTTRLGRVRILIESGQNLKVGAFARGLIETARSRGLAVPLSALLHGADGDSVQVVRDDEIVTRRVEVGLRSGGLVEVRSGLKDGDLVVAKAGSFLRNGDRVRPVKSAPERLSGVN
jgi:RND family efflux transporter MFP subunit